MTRVREVVESHAAYAAVPTATTDKLLEELATLERWRDVVELLAPAVAVLARAPEVAPEIRDVLARAEVLILENGLGQKPGLREALEAAALALVPLIGLLEHLLHVCNLPSHEPHDPRVVDARRAVRTLAAAGFAFPGDALVAAGTVLDPAGTDE